MDSTTWNWGLTRVAFVDCESSDLVKVGRPHPLLFEIAVVLTDGSLRELDRYEAVIRHDPAVLDAANLPPVVRDMHTKNGLLEALRGPDAVPVDEVERALIALLDRSDPAREHPIVWAGFSPSSLDRPLVAACMPAFYSRLHFRTLDLSAVKLAMKNWGGLSLEREEAEAHRAMTDTLASVHVARSVRRALAAAVPAGVALSAGA